MNRVYFGPGETAVVMPGTARRAKEEPGAKATPFYLPSKQRIPTRPKSESFEGLRGIE